MWSILLSYLRVENATWRKMLQENNFNKYIKKDSSYYMMPPPGGDWKENICEESDKK